MSKRSIGSDIEQETPEEKRMNRRAALAKLGLLGVGLLAAPAVMTVSEGHAKERGDKSGILQLPVAQTVSRLCTNASFRFAEKRFCPPAAAPPPPA